MAANFVFPAITSSTSSYNNFTTNVIKTSSNSGDSNTHFSADAMVLQNSGSRWFYFLNTSDNKYYAFYSNLATNLKADKFLDTDVSSNALFKGDKACWTNFYNDFHIPIPSLLDSISSSVALGFPISQGYLDLSSPISVSLDSNGKLSSTDWSFTTISYPDYYFSIGYDLDWFGSSDSGSGGDTPSTDYSQISNAIYSLGAVIIVVCFFSIIYKIFHRLRG